MRYWDSSALIPLLFEEAQSQILEQLVTEDPIVVSWWGSPVECFSGLMKLKRMGCLRDDNFLRARADFEKLMNALDFIPPSQILRDRALRLLSLHSLSAADSLQLASSLRWTQDETRGADFVCLDDRLRQAALAEGFAVLP